MLSDRRLDAACLSSRLESPLSHENPRPAKELNRRRECNIELVVTANRTHCASDLRSNNGRLVHVGICRRSLTRRA